MITFKFASILRCWWKVVWRKKCDKTYCQMSSESLQSLFTHIGYLAPVSISTSVQRAATQSVSAIKYLVSTLLCILHRPVELPCQSLVCAEWHCRQTTRSCCHDNSPLTAASINATPYVFLSLLSDVLLQCNRPAQMFCRFHLGWGGVGVVGWWWGGGGGGGGGRVSKFVQQ